MGDEGRQHRIDEITKLIVDIFIAHNVSPKIAKRVAKALIEAEIMGQKGHGVSRVSSYAAQAKSGKLDGHAVPEITSQYGGFLRVDAKHGFAYPAIDKAIDGLIDLAQSNAIACAAIYKSHHCGHLSAHVEKLARAGLVGLMFANTPKAIAPWGGAKPVFGTNPIAFSAPRRSADPIVVDLALSKIARGKIMAAKKAGERVPEGWALDVQGKPTQDPDAALSGTMLPMGDAKGATLALMVEILSATLTSALHAFEATSLFDGDGAPPAIGQFIIAIDPSPVSGAQYFDRIDVLVDEIVEQEGTRLPGSERLKKRSEYLEKGEIPLTAAQYQDLVDMLN